MTLLITIAVLTILIAINGLYVAAEFSAVSARRPRLAQMADEGSGQAGTMLDIVETPHKLDTFVAACQLGITVSSLVLGFYGQAQIMKMLQPALAQLAPSVQLTVQSILAIVILIFLTIFQVVLGELVPKNVGLQYPEKLAILTLPIMRWSMTLFRPLIALFNGSSQLVLRLMGVQAVGEHAHIHSPEEILMLVEESSAGGVLNEEERRLLVNTLHLRDLTAGKIMIPRNRMLAAPVEQSCNELLTLLAESPYSRLPIYEGDIDNIVGVVHLKDLLQAYAEQRRPTQTDAPPPPWDAHSILHPATFLPDSMPVDEAMMAMQRDRTNLAIVLDEYGGTAGLLTIEDLIEEIIGEFQDEFDAEHPPVRLLSKTRLQVRGDVLIDDLNDALGLHLPAESANTIGGLALHELGREPHPGDVVALPNLDETLTVRVESVLGHGVGAVSFDITPAQAARLDELDGEV
jgi:CBS domain containing-hemolysin-like protein